MITVFQLTKNYGKNIQALCGVDLDIGTGTFGLVGPNGAGKTTLMRILAGLLRPTSGKVFVLGHDISTRSGKLAVKSNLGYLPQEFGFYPDLTAYEFLEYIARLKGITDKIERKKYLEEALEMVDLTQFAKHRMRTFSGGMKHRVGIAQAFLGKPQLLVIDEPTSGLDPEERVRIRNLLGEMAIDCTVVLSTHIVEDVSQSCSNLAVINKGKVIFRGSPYDLIARARGHVWTIRTAQEHPEANLVVVSTMPIENGLQYRVLGSPDKQYQPLSIEPSLEDSYLWLMHQEHNDHVLE